MSTPIGVIYLLAQTTAADTAHWWGFALSWHRGVWSASVVPATADPDELDPRGDLEDVLGPTLWDAVTFIARTVAGPAPSADGADLDLLALEAMIASRAVTGLVVAYDAVLNGAPAEEWEIYGSGRDGAIYANGDTYAEAFNAISMCNSSS